METVEATVLPTDPEQSWNDDCDCLHPEAVLSARRVLGKIPAAAEIASLFAILGDATRMRVLLALGSGELCVTDLSAATGVNRTTISHQLRVLRSHRFVQRRREGKVVYYTLDDDHVSALLSIARLHAAESTQVVTGERVPA